MKTSVNIIVQNPEGKYLLQMRDDTPGICNPLKWGFFGGGTEVGEDPCEAATRELAEELSIDTHKRDFKQITQLASDDIDGWLVHIIRYNQPLDWAQIQINEGAGVGFFTKEEILKIESTENTKKIVEHFL